jgi:hypothetical protein
VRDVFCHNYVFVLTFSLNERKIGNLGFNCFDAIGNKVCNFLPMRSSAGPYIIQTDSGEIRRNWRYLVKIPESVKDNDKITSETAPDNSSKSDNENKDIPDNLSDQTDYYVTRSGRISKPLDKLNL